MNNKFNITNLPKIYQEHFKDLFPRICLSEDNDASQVRLCGVENVNCIPINTFYNEYCDNNTYEPSEQECVRLIRQLTCKDPAENDLAINIIFGLPNKYIVLKKCLSIYMNFLNLENLNSKFVSMIQIINSITCDSKIMPIDQLKDISLKSKIKLKDCVNYIIDIYNKNYPNE